MQVFHLRLSEKTWRFLRTKALGWRDGGGHVVTTTFPTWWLRKDNTWVDDRAFVVFIVDRTIMAVHFIFVFIRRWFTFPTLSENLHSVRVISFPWQTLIDLRTVSLCSATDRPTSSADYGNWRSRRCVEWFYAKWREMFFTLPFFSSLRRKIDSARVRRSLHPSQASVESPWYSQSDSPDWIEANDVDVDLGFVD